MLTQTYLDNHFRSIDRHLEKISKQLEELIDVQKQAAMPRIINTEIGVPVVDAVAEEAKASRKIDTSNVTITKIYTTADSE